MSYTKDIVQPPGWLRGLLIAYLMICSVYILHVFYTDV